MVAWDSLPEVYCSFWVRFLLTLARKMVSLNRNTICGTYLGKTLDYSS